MSSEFIYAPTCTPDHFDVIELQYLYVRFTAIDARVQMVPLVRLELTILSALVSKTSTYAFRHRGIVWRTCWGLNPVGFG